MRLGIDPKQADQLVRGSIVLPQRDWQVAARGGVCQGRLADAAEAAGADEVGRKSWPRGFKGAGWTLMRASPRPT